MPRQQAEKSEIHTRLMDKHYSPMIVRKSSKWGFPLYVSLITDDDLSDLDEVMLEFMTANRPDQDANWGIQQARNVCGKFVETLLTRYQKTEGAAVILYADKMFISSLHGDLMTHAACKQELFLLLNMSTGV
jgi:hypothetical protein